MTQQLAFNWQSWEGGGKEERRRHTIVASSSAHSEEDKLIWFRSVAQRSCRFLRSVNSWPLKFFYLRYYINSAVCMSCESLLEEVLDPLHNCYQSPIVIADPDYRIQGIVLRYRFRARSEGNNPKLSLGHRLIEYRYGRFGHVWPTLIIIVSFIFLLSPAKLSDRAGPQFSLCNKIIIIIILRQERPPRRMYLVTEWSATVYPNREHLRIW